MATSRESCDFELGNEKEVLSLVPVKTCYLELQQGLCSTFQLSSYVSEAGDHYENRLMSLDLLLPLGFLVKFLEIYDHFSFCTFHWIVVQW